MGHKHEYVLLECDHRGKRVIAGGDSPAEVLRQAAAKEGFELVPRGGSDGRSNGDGVGVDDSGLLGSWGEE